MHVGTSGRSRGHWTKTLVRKDAYRRRVLFFFYPIPIYASGFMESVKIQNVKF